MTLPMTASSNDSPDDLLTLAQAAAILQVRPPSVMNAVRREALPAIELDGDGPRTRRLRLRRADVEAYGAGRLTWKHKRPGWTAAWLPFSRFQTERRPGGEQS